VEVTEILQKQVLSESKRLAETISPAQSQQGTEAATIRPAADGTGGQKMWANLPKHLKNWGELVKLLLELAIALAGLWAILHKL
jgi:succinylarginine dihydrolase